ncbi:signal peptide peptidase-domain-containing protein [Coprinopsis sp. MPI-PUGE-AT-0042]|nr:signal peptide peptidase-domain-containing protein [Coprinopsis sp. MPI-PUGE-AT-0042]
MAASTTDWDLLSSYAGLLSLATLSIYAGSYSALPNPKPQPDDDPEDIQDDIGERMSKEDAYLFPIVGSVALLSLYLIVKYLGTTWINWILGWYFSIAGVGSVWQSSLSLLRYIYGSAWKKFDKVTVIVNKGPCALVNISFRTPSLFLLPLAVAPSAAYHLWAAGRRSIFVTDILGLSFSHNALSLLKLDSFKTGSILLSGLFLYDIWWVFGTEVMVKVATTLDLPIKLLWPKSMSFSSERGFTMLGLGDVVIPGTFIALALRYDYARYSAKVTKASRSRKGRSTAGRLTFNQAPKPYFFASLAAYVCGLATTMVVMHVFRKAQPALLYLSPACILSFVVTATLRGELAEVWRWTDIPQEEEHARRFHLEAKTNDSDTPLSSAGEEVGEGRDDVEKQVKGTSENRMTTRKRVGRR